MKILTQQDILNLSNIEVRSDNVSMYKVDDVYYKIWTQRSDSFYIINGLDFIWQGCQTMSPLTVGLINQQSCPAFIETLHNESGECIGYTTIKGNPICKSHSMYLKFIDTLVDISVDTGYGFIDVGDYNVIELNGVLSLIDIDFAPVKLDFNKQLSNIELNQWYNMFGPAKHEYYYQLYEKYLKLKNKW